MLPRILPGGEEGGARPPLRIPPDEEDRPHYLLGTPQAPGGDSHDCSSGELHSLISGRLEYEFIHRSV